jgi:hypothetical protein
MRRGFVLAVIALNQLLVVAFFAQNQPDEAILANEVRSDEYAKGEESGPILIIRVLYDRGRLSEIRDFIISNKLGFADVEPAEANRRHGVVLCLRKSKKSKRQEDAALRKKVVSSNLFVEIERDRTYTPGFFYVFAKTGTEAVANEALESWGVRPERWDISEVNDSEDPLFQCAVPPGDERFWIKRLKKYPFVRDVVLETGIYWSGILEIDERLAGEKCTDFEHLVRDYSLFIDRRGEYVDKSRGYYGLTYVRVPTGKECEFVGIFASRGIKLSLTGMLDGEAVTEANLVDQNSIGIATLTSDSISESAIVDAMTEFLTAGFPNSVVTHSGKTAVTVTSEHRGFTVLSTRRNTGWEKFVINVSASALKDRTWEVRVATKTWASGKGTGDLPPQPDHYKRITEPGATATDLSAEQRFSEELADKIAFALKKKFISNAIAH